MASSMAPSASSTSVLEPSPHVKLNKTRKWGRKGHICQTCHKNFSRKEHCARHERSHTHERPFQCRYCLNRYARKDLVSRHEKSLHAAIYIAPFQPSRSISIRQGGLKTPPAERMALMSQEHHEADSNDEEISNSSYVTIQVGLSPGSSTTPDHLDFVDLGGFHDDMDLALDMLLSPIDMEFSNMASKGVYDRSQNGVSLSGQMPTFDTLPTQSQLPSAEEGQNQDIQGYHFVRSHERLPPNVLDIGLNDSDFIEIMPYPELNGVGSSVSTTEAFLIDKDLPLTHNLPSQKSDQDREGPQSRNIDTHINDLQLQVQVCLPNDPAHLENSREQDSISLILGDRVWLRLLEDVQKYLKPEPYRTLKLPTAAVLQRFLSSYQTCFHKHFPILHLASLDLDQVPSPLILAMCSIGALYRLERKHAANLQQLADKALRLIDGFNPSTYKFSSSPKWMGQSRLLIAFGRVFSGSFAEARNALESLEYLTTEYTFRRIHLKNTRSCSHALSWTDWLERETSKRLLCGIFALSSLVSITFHVTPRFNLFPDTEIEIPHEEALWEATSSNQWLELMASRDQGPSLFVIDVVKHLLSGVSTDSHDVDSNWSDFARTIIMHAVNVHIYNLIQCTHALATHDLDNMQQNMRTAALYQSESALQKCQSLFTHRQSEKEQILDERRGSHRLNSYATLKVAYVNACSEVEGLNRLALLNTTSEKMAREIYTYIGSGQKRTSLVTMTVRQALDGLAIAVNAGTLLVMKTAAFKWSIEHAIADWNCALFIARWIHTLECEQHTNPLDLEERQIFQELNELLFDADSDQEDSISFAAKVVRQWADFFDDTWVWGITPQMSAVLRVMATVCENDREARFRPVYFDSLISQQN